MNDFVSCGCPCCERAAEIFNKVKYHIFELVCRKCGKTINRRMTQFDSLPNCPKCDNEMFVENVTTIKNEVKQDG